MFHSPHFCTYNAQKESFLLDRKCSSLKDQQTVYMLWENVCIGIFIGLFIPEKKFIILNTVDATYNKVETIVHDYLMQTKNFEKLSLCFKHNHKVYQLAIYSQSFSKIMASAEWILRVLSYIVTKSVQTKLMVDSRQSVKIQK